jgi:arsenate reductase
MIFICYPKCTTCQKARKWLDEQGLAYTFRDIKTENPSYDELKAWHSASGLPLRKFFNTSGLQYKSLNLKEKLQDMSEEEQLKLLATDGMLVKRPILIGDTFLLIGFQENEWKGKALGSYSAGKE